MPVLRRVPLLAVLLMGGGAVASAAQHAGKVRGVSETRIADDGGDYLAFPIRGRVRIFDRHARMIRTFSSDTSFVDMDHGTALIVGSDRRSALVDVATGRRRLLPIGVEVTDLGRYYVQGQQGVAPPNPDDPRPQDTRWVYISRATGKIVAATAPFSTIGTGGPDAPDQRTLDTRDRSIPADPSWIPADRVVLARSGQMALGYQQLKGAGVQPLELYRRGTSPRTLSTCPDGCRSAQLIGGAATWIEPEHRDPTIERAKVFSDGRVRTISVRDGTIIDVAHTRSRILIVIEDTNGETQVRTARIP